MLYRQMKYYVTVVDQHSFTKASYEGNISQSAISQQIQALERCLGVALIVRKNRTFVLTPAGKYFYNHSKVILKSISKMCKETTRIANEQEMMAEEDMCKANIG